MSLIKKILITIVGLFLLVLIAVATLVITVDPNEHRDRITGFVSEQTGRELSLGEMELSLFPQLGLRLENARLSNASGFGETPFATVDEVNLGVAILPLLQSKLEVDTLTLKGLNLDLQRNAQGVTNWDDLVKGKEEAEAHEKRDEEKHGEHGIQQLAALSIGGLDIRDGHVSWQDDLNQQAIELSPFNLTSGAITFGEFFTLEMDAKTQISKPQITTQTDLKADIKLLQNGQIEIRDLQQKNRLQSNQLPVAQVSTELNLPALVLTMAEKRIQLPDLTLEYAVEGGEAFPLRTIEGQLTLAELKSDVEKQIFSAATVQLTYNLQGSKAFALQTAEGQLDLIDPEFELQTQRLQSGPLTLTGDLTGESLPGGKASLSLRTQPKLDLSNQSASLEAIEFNTLDLTATGQVGITQLTSQPKISSQLSVAETNLRKLIKQLGLKIEAIDKMSDPKALTHAAADLEVDFDSASQTVNAKHIKVRLDDSTLQGQGSVRNFEAPNIAFDLTLDQLTIDRYLPPKPKKTTKAPPPSQEEELKIELPVELLRSLTLNGTVKAGNVVYDTLNPKNIVAVLKGKQGLFNLKPLKADIFKTQLLASAMLDVRGKQPKYGLTTDTQNVPVGDVLLAFTGNDRLSGTGAVKADITTAGERLAQFKQNLNGTAAVNLKNGAVKGFNLAQSIRQAKAKIAGEKAAGPTEELKTDFSTLESEVVITNGVVDTKKLYAKAPFMRINGLGQVDLVKEKLDYQVKTKIVGSDKGQGGEELTDLNGLTIPVKLKGDLTGPKVSLDLESLLEQKAKQEVEKKIEEQKQKVEKQIEQQKEEAQKKLEEELKGNLLKGLGF